jgi:hypothetical protein
MVMNDVTCSFSLNTNMNDFMQFGFSLKVPLWVSSWRTVLQQSSCLTFCTEFRAADSKSSGFQMKLTRL